ncbi:MAG: thioesterase domain-containing protein [Acidimicrobiia bacterium]
MGSDATARPPLVAIHTWRGETKYYDGLATAMGGSSGIVSIPPPVPDGDTLPRRVEDWVDHHESALGALSVEPPYRFLGWSFGGVVAVELARRLRAARTEVEYVGMIDTIRPRLLPLSNREFVWYHLGAAAALSDPAERIAYLRRKSMFLAYRQFPGVGSAAMRVLERMGFRRDRPVKHSVKPTDPMQISVHTSYLNYRAHPVPFPVSLYATGGSIRRAREPVLRWLPWLHGGYELAEIPGEHFTVFEPGHVEILAEAIRTSLRRVDGR